MTIKVQQIGNFDPEYSTENELRRALLSLGCEVETFQENHYQIFDQVCKENIPDLILWTRTRWHPDIPDYEQTNMLSRAHIFGVPVIGYHLDRWWGLGREHELETAPFFRVDKLYSADGGPHDWQQFNINHEWLPPGVDEAQCVRGTPQEKYRSELAFVGSWQGGYHSEHPHRMELVHWLTTNYGSRIKFYPEIGQPAVRGKDLADLYASVDVVIGDSCFTGTDHYWSDRVPETLGRGGYLIHPTVKGLEDHFDIGFDLAVWEPYNWQQLAIEIDYALANGGMRNEVRQSGQEAALARHTYKARMAYVLRQHVARGGVVASTPYVVGESGPEEAKTDETRPLTLP